MFAGLQWLEDIRAEKSADEIFAWRC